MKFISAELLSLKISFENVENLKVNLTTLLSYWLGQHHCLGLFDELVSCER